MHYLDFPIGKEASVDSLTREEDNLIYGLKQSLWSLC